MFQLGGILGIKVKLTENKPISQNSLTDVGKKLLLGRRYEIKSVELESIWLKRRVQDIHNLVRVSEPVLFSSAKWNYKTSSVQLFSVLEFFGSVNYGGIKIWSTMARVLCGVSIPCILMPPPRVQSRKCPPSQ